MNKQSLLSKNTTVIINNIPIELGINEHFNPIERKILNNRMQLSSGLFETPINYFTEFNKLTRWEKGYAYRLAFFHRITLDFKVAFSSPVNFEQYPIEYMENFNKLNELFDIHFYKFDKANANNIEYRNVFKKNITNIVFKFWLCGYGLLKGYAPNTIGNEQIRFIMNELSSDMRKKLARFLATMLLEEPLSPVNNIPETNEKLTVLESEIAKWKPIKEECNSEITSELATFLFSTIKERAQGECILEYLNNSGRLIRETLPDIRWGTFKYYSEGLRIMATMLFEQDFRSIYEILNGGILSVLSSEEFLSLSENKRKASKIATVQWVDYYNKINLLNLSVERIVPHSLRNKETTYGKIINFGSAYTLINTLLDDQSSLFDDNKIFDFRARRICLLMIATAHRVGEVLVLKRDCLKKDHEGRRWIYFHKTKNGNEHYVEATKDMERWAEQLKLMAPERKITISSNNTSTTFGDDEEDYRLVANIHDDNAMSVSSVNKFLKRIQDDLKIRNGKSENYFTSHDFRRMHSIYLKRLNKSKIDIQHALNQDNVYSQLPYLETKSPDIQNYFKEIAKEGLWSHISEVPDDKEIKNGLPLNQLLERSNKQGLTEEGKASALSFFTKIVDKVKQQKKNYPHNNSKPLVDTGMPMYTHNCIATVVVNCGHTELKCFSCKKYKPDSDKLDEHKAEILRYMILIHYYEDEAKKDKLEGETILQNKQDLKNDLDLTFNNLFQKFDFKDADIRKLEGELYKTAKMYYKKNKKTKPTLTFSEALLVIKKKGM